MTRLPLAASKEEEEEEWQKMPQDRDRWAVVCPASCSTLMREVPLHCDGQAADSRFDELDE